MARVILNIDDPDWGFDDVAEELRYVADQIEDTYVSGITPFGDTWELTGLEL